MTALTTMQQKVFDYICEHSDTNGFPPSYSDIASHFDFSSDGTVRTYLEHLEKKGYIQRQGRARGIKILKPKIPESVPILGQIAAGAPTLATEDPIGTLKDIGVLNYHSGRFALLIQGDSMKDAGILNGDYAIIQVGSSVTNGQIAAVKVDGHATLKRVYFEKERVRLQPENEFYEPLYIERGDMDSTIIGKYVGLVRDSG